MKKQILLLCLNIIILTGCAATMPKLGIHNAQLTPCPNSPNCVSSHATDEDQFIAPLKVKATPQEVQDRLLRILNSLKRVNISDIQANYIRADFTSAIFRFVDDVEFYFPASDTPETLVYLRSASRVGHSDLGANRKRMEQIKEAFDALK